MKHLINKFMIFIACLFLTGCGSKSVMSIENTSVSIGEFAVFTRFLQANQYSGYQDAYREYLKQSGQTDINNKVMSVVWDTKVQDKASSSSQDASNSVEPNVGAINNTTPSDAIVEHTEGDVLKNLAINSLKEFIITSNHAKDYNIKLDDSELKFINEMATKYYNQNKKALKYDNVKLQDVVDFMKHYNLFVKIVNYIQAQNITSVSDAESRVINISYLAIPYDSDEAAVSSVIHQIYKNVKSNNTDLSEIAKQYNAVYNTIDFAPMDKSADYVFDDKDLDIMSRSYNNDILEPIKGDNKTYYIIKINNIDKPDESVKYKEQLIAKYKMQAYVDLYNQWLSDTKINYDLSLVNNFKVTDSVIFKAVK